METLEQEIARLVGEEVARITRRPSDDDPTRLPEPAPAPERTLAELEAEAQLTKTGLAAGVQPRAMEDFLGRVARELPHFESRRDPTGPATLEEFIVHLQTEAPHLFRPRGNGRAPAGDPWGF